MLEYNADRTLSAIVKAFCIVLIVSYILMGIIVYVLPPAILAAILAFVFS